MLIQSTDFIPIDSFTSASGLWRCVFGQQWVAAHNENCYYLVVYYAGSDRVRKVYRFTIGDEPQARMKWEEWKQVFGQEPFDARYESDAPPLKEPKRSPPYITEEDKAVALKMKPQGGRLFVRDIPALDEVTVRAQNAGLVAMVSEQNMPKPTMGVVLLVGPDPLAQELYEEGDIVMFSQYAGHHFTEAGETYRSIELHQIIGSRKQADGVEDLLGPVSEAKEELAKFGAVAPISATNQLDK